MIVKFDSKAGQVLMNAEHAVPLLKAMGQSGDVPGAALAAQVPDLLARLEQAVATKPAAGDMPEPETGEIPVSLRQRAFPLIDLLQKTTARQCDLVWERL
ncbi:MAG: DUF1840 domain-containing protein [Burkholderiales bacterium]|nr:DUF1840 domain-containing protein [Burkholderiales bacterium]